MIKTYKIRLLPTKEQEQSMWKHIGCCRFVWNWGLDVQKQEYAKNGKKLSCFDLIKRLTPLKREEEYAWLNEVSMSSLQIILRDLDKAYANFFGSAGFPKFKSRKKSKSSYPIINNRTYFDEKVVTIPKLGKVKYKTNYNIPLGKEIKLYNPRISHINNKWILTVGIDCENQAVELTDKSMGIDLGVKDLCNIAFGNENIVVKNVNKTSIMKKKQKKLKRLQCKVSRKYRQNGSYEKTSNILKLEAQIKELYYHTSMIRQNHIHQTTHMLVTLKPKKVVMEDLNISGMMKNKHLSKAIQEQCFYEFIRQMKYKCEWNGIEFTQVDRFYPSSKTCSCCGTIKSDLKLSDRIYNCPDCGLSIDRDYNAAINLMKYVA